MLRPQFQFDCLIHCSESIAILPTVELKIQRFFKRSFFQTYLIHLISVFILYSMSSTMHFNVIFAWPIKL